MMRLSRRVPVVLQTSSSDCGAACATMLLRFYGVPQSLREMRRELGTGRDGTSAGSIAAACRRYGLELNCTSVETLVRTVALPAIVHWNRRHFVVVERVGSRNISIVDPAHGRCTLTHAAFAERFSGTVLAPAATAFQQKALVARVETASWQRYVSRAWALRGVPRLLIGGLLASVGLQVLGLVAPLLTKVLVDASTSGQLRETISLFGRLTVVLLVSRAVMGYARNTAMARLQIHVDRTLTPAFLGHMLALPYSFFQNRSTGDLLQRVGSNATIREMLTGQLLGVLLDFPFALVYLALCFAASPAFAAAVLVIAIAQGILLRLSLERTREFMQEAIAVRASEQGAAVEIIRGIATIKASNAVQPAIAYWSSHFIESLEVAYRRTIYTARVELAVGMLRFGAPLILLLYGAALVRDGAMTLGTMLAAQGIALALLGPVASLIQTLQQLQTIHAVTDRIEEVLEEKREEDAPADLPSARFESLIVKDLCFRYQADARDTLSGIDLSILRRQKLAVVGATGSGKTTLLHLLVGLSSPTGGTISVNGAPISAMAYAEWRQRCGIVLQEQWLFDGTIAENVGLSRPVANRAEIERACSLAEIHDEILRWPLGYSTKLGEGGRNVSGGQRQRIALARALLGSPEVLFLDEATSHLDIATEERIERNIKECGCTIVTAAHRISSIRNSDWIIVLDRGMIAEQGSHDTLMKLGGKYCRLLGEEVAVQKVRTLHSSRLVG